MKRVGFNPGVKERGGVYTWVWPDDTPGGVWHIVIINLEINPFCPQFQKRMDEQSGESEEEEVTGEGIDEAEIEELVPEWVWQEDKEMLCCTVQGWPHRGHFIADRFSGPNKAIGFVVCLFGLWLLN